MSIRAKSGKVICVIAAKPTMGAFSPEAFHTVNKDVVKSWPVYGEATYSDCGLYRYGLLRRWDTALPIMVYVMLNPSTASHEEDDPTIVRCMDFAMRHDCGGILVVNLFAYRTPKPAVLWEASYEVDIWGPENFSVLVRVLKEARKRKWPICAGWGAAEHKHVVTAMHLLLEAAGTAGVSLQCLGYTKTGMPRHPLYLSSLEFLRPWPPKGATANYFKTIPYYEKNEFTVLDLGLDE